MQSSLMRLRCIPLLQANLLDVVQPLIRIDENPRIICFLLFALCRGFEAFAEVAMLPELIKKVQIAALLIMIIKYGVLALNIRRLRHRCHGNAGARVHGGHRHLRLRLMMARNLSAISADLFLGLLVLLLLDLVLRNEPSLEGVLLALGHADVMRMIIL